MFRVCGALSVYSDLISTMMHDPQHDPPTQPHPPPPLIISRLVHVMTSYSVRDEIVYLLLK